jgi:hypothetical protein
LIKFSQRFASCPKESLKKAMSQFPHDRFNKNLFAETLLFRLMGKGRVQQAAMAEVAALPAEHPYRKSLLNLLVSYRMELAAKQDAEPEEQELVMQLSPLYLEQLEVARLDGEQRGE